MPIIDAVAYIYPKKSMRGENSVSLTEVERKKVMSAERNIAKVMIMVLRRFERLECLLVIRLDMAHSVIMVIRILYGAVMNGKVIPNWINTFFKVCQAFAGQSANGVVCRL